MIQKIKTLATIIDTHFSYHKLFTCKRDTWWSFWSTQSMCPNAYKATKLYWTWNLSIYRKVIIFFSLPLFYWGYLNIYPQFVRGFLWLLCSERYANGLCFFLAFMKGLWIRRIEPYLIWGDSNKFLLHFTIKVSMNPLCWKLYFFMFK